MSRQLLSRKSGARLHQDAGVTPSVCARDSISQHHHVDVGSTHALLRSRPFCGMQQVSLPYPGMELRLAHETQWDLYRFV